MDWSQLKRESVTYWTADGLMLDEIVFLESIQDGKTFFGDEKSNPFKSNMSEIEIAELFIESLKINGQWSNGKYKELKLQKFGSFDGFNFGISLVNKDGLAYKGLASGAIIEKELHIIFFLATEFHYYDKFKNNFLAIVSSIQKT